MAVSAMFALRNAVASSRKDSGLPNTWFTFGEWAFDYLKYDTALFNHFDKSISGSATTPEEVFLKTGNSIERFTL